MLKMSWCMPPMSPESWKKGLRKKLFSNKPMKIKYSSYKISVQMKQRINRRGSVVSFKYWFARHKKFTSNIWQEAAQQMKQRGENVMVCGHLKASGTMLLFVNDSNRFFTSCEDISGQPSTGKESSTYSGKCTEDYWKTTNNQTEI